MKQGVITKTASAAYKIVIIQMDVVEYATRASVIRLATLVTVFAI